jgi:hypothetical protein
MVSAISPDSIVNPAFAMTTTAASSAGGRMLTFGPSVSTGSYPSGTAIYGYQGSLYTLFITSVERQRSPSRPGIQRRIPLAARYPRIEGRAPRTVEFLEFVYVADK